MMRIETITRILFWACLLALPAMSAQASAGEQPHPAAGQTPARVVRLQLKALRNNDPATDAGITAAYRFSSPNNRRAVGNRGRFAHMIHISFKDMLSATGATVRVINKADKRAAVLATLAQDDDSHTRYLFLLSQQAQGSCAGCWLTDGVVPVALSKPSRSGQSPSAKPL